MHVYIFFQDETYISKFEYWYQHLFSGEMQNILKGP